MIRLLSAVLISLIMMSGTATAQGLSDVRAGNVAFKDGDLERAADLFTSAIDSGSLNDDALSITLNNRGVVQGELGDFDAAIADYFRALELRPEDATTRKNLRVAHVRRGQSHQSAGDQDAALRDYNEAITIQPEHYLAYFYRAQLHVEQGDFELAVIDLERASMLEPDDPRAQEALDQVQHDLALARDLSTIESKTAESAAEPAEPGIATIADNTGVADDTQGADTTVGNVVPSAGPLADSERASADVADEPAADPQPQATAAVQPPSNPQDPPAEAAQPAVGPGPESGAASRPVAAIAGADGEAVKMRTNNAVNYRSGPSNEDPRVGTVDAGVVVTVVGDTLGWKHIILPSGDRGFIYKRWLEPTDP